jgi:TonB family protein
MLLFLLTLAAAAPPGGVPAEAPPRQVAGSISDADYPEDAIRAHEQGTTKVRLFITSTGEVDGCQVAESSGSQVLDKTTCALVTERFRYEPARDANGEAIRGKAERRVTWVLPEDGPETTFSLPTLAYSAGELRLLLAADTLGTRCAVETDGETFVEVAPFLCPPPVAVDIAELRQDAGAIMTVIAFTPDGGVPAVSRAPARGILLGRAAADFEFDPAGTIASCRDIELPPPLVPSSPCAGATLPIPAIAPSPEPGSRRARITYEIYRMGAPET